MSSAFSEYVDGKGVAAICKGLERDRILTVSGKPKWCDSVVRKMHRSEKYFGELLLQKTVTLDYLTKYRVENKNHTEQYRVENNHQGIVSKEIWDMAQKECERPYEIYSGANKDRGKTHQTLCVQWKTTGKRCGAKAVDDEVLKAAFVKVYNEEFKDKGNFYKAFLANVEKVIEKNNISE